MKDKTKVKEKNVGKVAEVKTKNPQLTQREIAKKTGLAHNTVIKAEKELSQNGVKDKTIAYIVDSAKNRLKRLSKVFDRYIDELELKDELNSFDVRVAKDIAKDDQARITVLGGDLTKDDGGFKDTLVIKLPEG